ncbi:hypothetical protein [Sulfuricaulis sp.]|jgi:hypothetical protein|uniref:hypothetical protein n=1 Tax=Sulfuricaulis sp. TaxID=2003553 RepID=UPI00355A7735
MSRVLKKNLWVYLLSALVFATAPAKAATLSFFCITNNLAGDCAIGASQMTVTVSDPGAGQALFLFKNLAGGSAASITDVYFDDGTLLALSTITNGPGVSFSEDATPPNLPGGNNISPPFQTAKGFSADSNPPVQPNGVNPGEWLRIYFSLQSGSTFNDVINELGDGRLRIGIHVQGFSSSGSESFVNVPVPVPVPAAVWLFGSGLVSLTVIGRRKKFSARKSTNV